MSKEESVIAAYSKSNKKRKNIKREKKMKQRMKKQRAEVFEMEESVADVKIEMESSKSFVMEAEDEAKKIERLFGQIEEQNKLHSKMILWGELLADYIQNGYNILP